MKAPDIVESWKWRDPAEIIERLLAQPTKTGTPLPAPAVATPPKDRYHVFAKRLRIRQLMKRRKQ